MGLGLDNPLHWLFILVALLLIFGARRLPEIGRSLGSGIREFKRSVTGEIDHAGLPGVERQQASQPAPADRPAAETPVAAASQHADTRAA